jgi:MFS family permease
VARRRHLVDALARPEFRRLLAVRLACQFGDGVFQASLAATVLFNPERQAQASDVAAGFAALLLPYSFVGPFAGVLIDRWWRQRVLTVANIVRVFGVVAVAGEIASGTSGIPFYASALVIVSLSRFVLSALSAALPRVIAPAELVTANAFSATVGTVLTAIGGGAAIGVRALLGSNDHDYAIIAAAALVPYLLAALAARGFATAALGPSEDERRARDSPAEVLRGLVAGAREVRQTPPVAAALTTVAAHRLFYGIWTVCTLLLYRNRFTDSGFFRAGLTGLSQVLAAVAAGGALAAVVTPAAFRRFGAVPWVGAMLLASAVVEVACGLPYTKPSLLLAALLLGFGAQAIKITVDTLVQRDIEDAFRGRVFALYDMLFNLALVMAAAITAVALPDDGRSPTAVVAIGAAWALIAAAYLMNSRRTSG